MLPVHGDPPPARAVPPPTARARLLAPLLAAGLSMGCIDDYDEVGAAFSSSAPAVDGAADPARLREEVAAGRQMPRPLDEEPLAPPRPEQALSPEDQDAVLALARADPRLADARLQRLEHPRTTGSGPVARTSAALLVRFPGLVDGRAGELWTLARFGAGWRRVHRARVVDDTPISDDVAFADAARLLGASKPLAPPIEGCGDGHVRLARIAGPADPQWRCPKGAAYAFEHVCSARPTLQRTVCIGPDDRVVEGPPASSLSEADEAALRALIAADPEACGLEIVELDHAKLYGTKPIRDRAFARLRDPRVLDGRAGLRLEMEVRDGWTISFRTNTIDDVQVGRATPLAEAERLLARVRAAKEASHAQCADGVRLYSLLQGGEPGPWRFSDCPREASHIVEMGCRGPAGSGFTYSTAVCILQDRLVKLEESSGVH